MPNCNPRLSKMRKKCCHGQKNFESVAVCPRLQLTSHTQPTLTLSRIKCEMYFYKEMCSFVHWSSSLCLIMFRIYLYMYVAIQHKQQIIIHKSGWFTSQVRGKKERIHFRNKCTSLLNTIFMTFSLVGNRRENRFSMKLKIVYVRKIVYVNAIEYLHIYRR